MNGIFLLILAAFAVELSRQILVWLASDSNGSANTYDGRHDGSSALLDRLAQALSVENFDTTKLFMLALAAALASAAVGMVSHLLLGARAFGATVNGYIVFFSALFSGVAWLNFGPPRLTQHEYLLLLIIVLGALSGLFGCILLRTALFDYLDTRFSRPAPRAVERLEAATRRPKKTINS
ncbi:MAG TPA: hypothetical protein VED87_11400 [Methylocystis sp.]|nr:hypothetical protein [Methylocystis sp.]